MANLTKSQPNNITSPDGNSLAIFVDGVSGALTLKDVNGNVQPMSGYIGGSPFKYGSGTDAIQPVLGNNCASGLNSSVVGGMCNNANGGYSIIGGGQCNVAGSQNTYLNVSSVTFASIYSPNGNYVGGQVNYVSPSRDFFCFNGNTANSFVGADSICKVNFNYGTSNLCNTSYCIQGAVYDNINAKTRVSFNPTFPACVVASSYCNAGVFSGYNNKALARYSFIGGGYCNSICKDACDSFIGGGFYNVSSFRFSTIGGGVQNTASCFYSTIGGGGINISSRIASTVAGGSGNVASGDFSTVGGGRLNFASGCYSIVGGGYRNTASALFSIVVGGACNKSCKEYSIIGGGSRNVTTGYSSFIGGGSSNSAYTSSTVGGGVQNIASGCTSFIGGGQNNISNNKFTSIAGGCFNNSISCFSTIGGGFRNVTSGCYSGILSGKCNVASGCYSGILAGRNNNVNSCSDAMIVGSNITADRACTLFANNLSLKNIPTSASGLPSGAVWNSGGMLAIVP